MNYVDNEFLFTSESVTAGHPDKIAEGCESLLEADLWEHVVKAVLPAELYDEQRLRASFLVNPTGRFVIGGPVGDCGLTLHRPICSKTAAYGHFGREDDDFTWERTYKADALREAAGLAAALPA